MLFRLRTGRIRATVWRFTRRDSNPSSIDATSIRIDHRFTDSFSIFGRYADTPSSSTSRLTTNLAQTVANELRNQTLTLGSNYFISSGIANDFRFNYTKNKADSIYETTAFGGSIPYNIPDIPNLSGSPDNRIFFGFLYGARPSFNLLNQTAKQNQFNFVDTVSAVFGRHTFKVGFDYRRTSNELVLPPRYMPINISSQNELLTNNLTNLNLVIYTLDKLRPVYQNYSAFAQDDWRVNSRLSISLGLRYEVNPAPTDGNDNPPYTIDQVDNLATTRLRTSRAEPLWKTTYNNFAPRLGVAYQVSNRAGWETVVRAGSGIYYDLGNTQASDGYGRAGFRITTRFTSPYPLTNAQINAIPAPSITTPYTEAVITDDPNLKLPFTVQWSGAVEQTFGGKQSFTVSYIGASGQRLLVDRSYLPRGLGNLNFGPNAALILTTNVGRSSYHALQSQFQRRLSRGFQANASYTWSHSIDNATSNFTVTQLTKGSSDFDIRHNFQAAFSYDIPGEYENGFASSLLKHWAIDGRISARTALPVNIIGATGIDAAIPYLSVDFQPNVVAGQALYIDDATVPGGKRINFAAFAVARNATGGLTQGNLGRNSLRGFGAFQTDLALRREFPIGERFKVQFRAESFNIFNRANFGAINNQLGVGSALFGRATNTQNGQLGGLNSLYQVGGPRSFQFALKLLF
jgi:TonB dependent receptor